MDEFLSEYFREQQERMEISDEDWEEYEERIRQQNVQKSVRRDERAKKSKSELEANKNVSRETSFKKRKLDHSDSGPSDLNRSSSPFECPSSENLRNSSKITSSSKAVAGVTDIADADNIETSKEPPRPVKRARKSATEEKRRVQAERLVKNNAQQARHEAEKLKIDRERKEARMTPLEYAAILQDKWKSKVENTPPKKLFLKDKIIFLIFEEQDKAQRDTRIKLDIIAKNGGKVALAYDPNEVTHIIPSSTSITLRKTLRALGLKSLSDIPPSVKTVKWDWIVSGLTKRTLDPEIMHELFSQRMAFMYTTRSAPKNSGTKGKEKETVRATSHSVIEDFNSMYDSPNEDDATAPMRLLSGDSGLIQSEHRTASSVRREEHEDPLLPFYAKAREEAQAEESDDEFKLPKRAPQANPKARKLKGFQCDSKSPPARDSPNRDVIEKLAELRELHRESGTQDDMWRVIGYQKAIGSLTKYPTRIKSREEAMKLPGISDKTADKIMEIIKTGELRRIEYTKTEGLDSIRIFRGIYGVGSSTARKWYNDGLKSLSDLRRAVQSGSHKLWTAQELGLRFYDDINDRMPRAEAQGIFDKIKRIALGIDPRLSMEIMGSYRRGKDTCGDVDILITRPTNDGHTHTGVLPRLCELLRKEGILTEDLATPDEWGALEATYRGLCRKDAASRRRRIDFLCVPYECRGAARIYYTGDDIFNRSIRLKANKMNMSLNQRGLYEGIIRDPRDRKKKLSTGTILCGDSERKIFEILGVPWQEPHERVRSG